MDKITDRPGMTSVVYRGRKASTQTSKTENDYIAMGKFNTKISALGPVVQSIVSLTTSLRRHLVQYMPTTLSNTLLFFVGKM